MFLPDNLKDPSTKNRENLARKAFVDIEKWSVELIPQSARQGVKISVQEVQCGDPECSPIDTAIIIIFPSGGRGMVGLPMESMQVNKEHLKACFPPEDVLIKWSKGEEADWPRVDDDENEDDEILDFPQLRFGLDQLVECKTGADPVTGWSKGKIIQLWYRENGWPKNTYAPYKIELEDGNHIYAPADQDQIIRAA